nr:hypothetical protein [Tanacetum cinerariifolium]
MHNYIMAAGSRDRLPMLATGRYAQWLSRLLRYIDTRKNGDALRKCILQGPYTLYTVVVLAIPATENSPAVPEHTTVETPQTMSPENKAHYELEKEAIHLILTGMEMKYIQLYKNVDTTPRYKNDNQAEQFRNQRTLTVVGARENVRSLIVQQTGIQCFNCKKFGQFAKECTKPKRVKDFTYHKEKMFMCKQAEKGVPIQAEHVDWLEDTNDEIDEQELEAHYSFMAKIQEFVSPKSNLNAELLEHIQNDDEYNVFPNVNQHYEQSESTSNTCLVEKDDSNVTPNSLEMCENDIQTDQNAKDECAALANSIANLKLDVDENKKIQKKLKKANASLTQELTECKSILAKTSRTLRESNRIRDGYLVALQTKQTKFEKYKAYNDRTVDYDILGQKHSISLELALQECRELMKHDTVCKEKASNAFKNEREQYFEIQDLKAQLQDKNVAISELENSLRNAKENLFDEIKEISKTSVANDTLDLVPQRQKASDYDNSYPVPQLQNVSPSADTSVPSQQELYLLFGPLYDEFFNAGILSVNKSSSPTDNSKQRDTQPTTNIQSTTEPSIPTTANAEENNDN